MEPHIEDDRYRVDPDAELAAHIDRYPLKLAGLPLDDYFALKAAQSADAAKLQEAA